MYASGEKSNGGYDNKGHGKGYNKGKGYNNTGKGYDNHGKVTGYMQGKGYNNKGKGYDNKGKGYDNNGDDNEYMHGEGYNNKGNSKHRRANQTSWGARIRRSEKRKDRQQAHHDDKLQRMSNEIIDMDVEINKQMQEIAQEQQEAHMPTRWGERPFVDWFMQVVTTPQRGLNDNTCLDQCDHTEIQFGPMLNFKENTKSSRKSRNPEGNHKILTEITKSLGKSRNP